MKSLYKWLKRLTDWVLGLIGISGTVSTAAFFIRLGIKFSLIVALVAFVSGLVSPMVVSYLGINPELWTFFISLVPSHLPYDVAAVFSTQLAVMVGKYKLDAIPKELSTFNELRKRWKLPPIKGKK